VEEEGHRLTSLHSQTPPLLRSRLLDLHRHWGSATWPACNASNGSATWPAEPGAGDGERGEGGGGRGRGEGGKVARVPKLWGSAESSGEPQDCGDLGNVFSFAEEDASFQVGWFEGLALDNLCLELLVHVYEPATLVANCSRLWCLGRVGRV
jgi:hypothetical protein